MYQRHQILFTLPALLPTVILLRSRTGLGGLGSIKTYSLPAQRLLHSPLLCCKRLVFEPSHENTCCPSRHSINHHTHDYGLGGSSRIDLGHSPLVNRVSFPAGDLG